MNMDSKLVSKQEYEITYIAYRYKIPKDIVEKVVEDMGVSRRKIYKKLRELGYTINIKRK